MRAKAWTGLCVAALVMLFFYLRTQPRISEGNGVGLDGANYHAVADDLLHGRRPSAVAPFVMRLGTPFLASAAARAGSTSLIDAFMVVNLLAALTTIGLMSWWLQRHTTSVWAKTVPMLFFLCAPHAALRFTLYYPVLVDALTVTCLTAGLLALERYRRSDSTGALLAVMAITAIGCTIREVALVIGVAALVIPSRRHRLLRLGPLVVGIASLFAIRRWIIEIPSAYSTVESIKYWARWKTPAQLAVAPFLVYGPLLVLPLFSFRAAWTSLRRHPEWCVCLGVTGFVAWLGGSDTERLLAYTSPLVTVLTAVAIDDRAAQTAPAAWVAAAFVQLISFGVFKPIDAERYASMWTFSMTRTALVTNAVSYGVASGILLMVVYGHRSPRAQH